MSCSFKTETGKRKANEDSLTVLPLASGGHVLCVADGMGGHSCGEVASGTIISELERNLSDINNGKPLLQLVKDINDTVYRTSQSNPELNGMGSTIVVVQTDPVHRTACVVHAGDSRVYLFRNGSLSRLTKDHSYVQALVDGGIISDEDAFLHPKRNIITKCIGYSVFVEPEQNEVALESGDILLLCSDGLHGTLRDPEIESVLSNASSLDNAVNDLIRRALEEGSSDNITVVLYQFEGTQSL